MGQMAIAEIQFAVLIGTSSYSGKTSLIHLNWASILTKLMGRVPSRSVEPRAVLLWLISDQNMAGASCTSRTWTPPLPVVYHETRSRRVPHNPKCFYPREQKDSDNDEESTLSLSGLLNSLDGVATAE